METGYEQKGYDLMRRGREQDALDQTLYARITQDGKGSRFSTATHEEIHGQEVRGQ